MKILQANLIRSLTELKAPLFIVLIGAPGSGKSTFIKALSKELAFVVGSTDDQIDAHAHAEGITYSEAMSKLNFKTLKRNLEETVTQAISKGEHVIIDQTNMNKKSRGFKLAWAKPEYVKVAIDFDVPDKVLLERVDARAAATGKNIPRVAIFSMLKSYQAPSRDEGFDHIFTLGL